MSKMILSAILMSLSLNAFADTEKFIRTSIEQKDCQVRYDSETDPDAPIDGLDMTCAGVGPYSVNVGGGDLRYNVSLVYEQQEIRLSNFMSFHFTGSNVIEWLLVDDVPKALIHRINAAEGDRHDRSYLIVSKLDGANSCPVAQIAPSIGKDQNLEARSVARRAQSLPCL